MWHSSLRVNLPSDWSNSSAYAVNWSKSLLLSAPFWCIAPFVHHNFNFSSYFDGTVQFWFPEASTRWQRPATLHKPLTYFWPGSELCVTCFNLLKAQLRSKPASHTIRWHELHFHTELGVGDRFRLFIQTLNNAWKPFNSIFNSKWNQKYSFNEFIHSNWTKLFKMWQIYPKNAQILLIHISGLSFQVKWNILKTWEVLDEFC